MFKPISLGLGLGLGFGLIYILATNSVALIVAGFLFAFLLGGVWTLIPALLVNRLWSNTLRPGQTSHHYRWPAPGASPPSIPAPPPPEEFPLLPAATYPSFDDDQPVA